MVKMEQYEQYSMLKIKVFYFKNLGNYKHI